MRAVCRTDTGPDRFGKYYAVNSVTTCWEWTGFCGGDGYGRFGYGNENRAHRASYLMFIGVIPPGMSVLHRCDNPRCVNPDHLFLGTGADNAADRDEKGRQSRGERHSVLFRGEKCGAARLTESQVIEIKNSRESNAGMARKFRISAPHVSMIRSGKRWGHLSSEVKHASAD